MPPKQLTEITNVTNGILRLQHFPRQWKTAYIVMIKKPGKNPLFPQNYRPISLLSHIGKIAERVILNRLKEETEELQINPDVQFGFRPAHYTVLQLARLTENITNGMNNRKHTAVLAVNIQKAFDCI